jgi:hypothetical protein
VVALFFEKGRGGHGRTISTEQWARTASAEATVPSVAVSACCRPEAPMKRQSAHQRSAHSISVDDGFHGISNG